MRNALEKFCFWLEQGFWTKWFALPLVGLLPTTAVAASDKIEWLQCWFATRPVITFICLFWSPVVMVPAIAMYHKFKPSGDRISIQQLSKLQEVLTRIVGAKSQRFAKVLRVLRSDEAQFGKKRKKSGREVFRTITQPKEQWKEILQGIWFFFREGNKPGVEIRVALARMGEEHVKDFEAFYPPDKVIRSQPHQLQSDNAGYSTAKRNRTILVIENTAEEAKNKVPRFVVTSHALKNEENSMICFPVMDHHITGDVPFVISICASEPDYFSEAQTPVYEDILKPFAQRIVLEYYLEEIKKSV